MKSYSRIIKNPIRDSNIEHWCTAYLSANSEDGHGCKLIQGLDSRSQESDSEIGGHVICYTNVECVIHYPDSVVRTCQSFHPPSYATLLYFLVALRAFTLLFFLKEFEIYCIVQHIQRLNCFNYLFT